MLEFLAYMLVEQANMPAPSTARTPVSVVREDEVRHSDPIGSCVGNGQSFDLRRLMILENRTIDIDTPRGSLRVSLNREMLLIDAINGPQTERVFEANIGYEAEPRGDIDIELKFGYINGVLVVFWKETFQNRIYRQGMYRIIGDNIAFLCAGRGGVTSR